MKINEITIGEAREIANLFQSPNQTQVHPYEIGGLYFIRTVTHHYTGRLVAVYPQELVLEDVAWIADDGRLADTLKTGNFSEVEPYPSGKVIIGRSAILDASITPILHRSQK